jgi:hypothetical protein
MESHTVGGMTRTEMRNTSGLAVTQVFTPVSAASMEIASILPSIAIATQLYPYLKPIVVR